MRDQEGRRGRERRGYLEEIHSQGSLMHRGSVRYPFDLIIFCMSSSVSTCITKY